MGGQPSARASGDHRHVDGQEGTEDQPATAKDGEGRGRASARAPTPHPEDQAREHDRRHRFRGCKPHQKRPARIVGPRERKREGDPDGRGNGEGGEDRDPSRRGDDLQESRQEMQYETEKGERDETADIEVDEGASITRKGWDQRVTARGVQHEPQGTERKVRPGGTCDEAGAPID